MIQQHTLALAGGVGGAKLAMGLADVLPSNLLTIVGNTGDDETFHGLHISPDLDTVMYTLAGLADPDKGWGIAGDTFMTLDMLKRYCAPTWFNLGDRDMSTHIRRTDLLSLGWTLSQVTRDLCSHLGVFHTLTPMSDQPVSTIAVTDEGPMPFQSYFVKRQCHPRLLNVYFNGATDAHMAPAFRMGLETATTLIFCPSNPVVSIAPILAVCGVNAAIRAFKGMRIAVSPIVGGRALLGPAAKMLAELGEDVNCVGVARRMAGLSDILVIDHVDSALAPQVEAMGMRAHVTDTMMETHSDKVRLANELCELAEGA